MGVNKQVIFLQRLFNPLFVCGERKGRVGREQVRKEEKKNRIIEIVGLRMENCTKQSLRIAPNSKEEDT